MNSFLCTIILTLTLYGCSNFIIQDDNLPEYQRLEVKENRFPVELNDLMSFKSTVHIKPDQNFIKRLKLIVKINNLEVIYKRNDLLPKDVSYMISPMLVNNSYQLNIHYSKNSLNDQDAFTELQTFLELISTRRYRNAKSFFELYYNAQNNDLLALYTLSKLRQEVFGQSTALLHFDEGFINRNISVHNKWKQTKEIFNEFIKKENKTRLEKQEKRRTIMSRLDFTPKDQQLYSLILKNQRKEVAALFRAYLPWEQMSPFENKFWTLQLEIIEFPLPLDERVLVAKELSPGSQQIRNEEIILISPVLMKKTGAWNTRLRELEGMNEKFIGIDELHNTSEFSKAARVTNMFYKHSINPEEGPFLVVTPISRVAKDFESNKMGLFLIDPRAIYFNHVSAQENEISFLQSLITFPDELALVSDYPLSEEIKLKYAKQIANSNANFKGIDQLLLPVLGELSLDLPMKANKQESCFGLMRSFF